MASNCCCRSRFPRAMIPSLDTTPHRTEAYTCTFPPGSMIGRRLFSDAAKHSKQARPLAAARPTPSFSRNGTPRRE